MFGSGAGRLARRFERRFVVGMLGDFLHVFRVGDLVVLVDHEHGAREQMQLLDQHAVFLAKLGGAIVAERRDLSTPAAPHHRACANGKSIEMLRICTSPGSFAASWLKRRVSASHTGVSSEGTVVMILTLPLNCSSVAG